MSSDSAPALAIVGTNASGKSSIGINVARSLAGEIISADSRQVFVGFDLCSGKASAEERGEIPHHLIDVVQPGSSFTVFDYQSLAMQSIESSVRAGHVPILVGGTPLYADAVIRNYSLGGAPPDPVERAELESLGARELCQVLDSLFPGEAERVGQLNHRRLVRAVERARRGISYDEAHATSPGRPWRVFGVSWPMPELENRIRARLRRRLDAGMVDEVASGMRNGVSEEVLWNLGLEYRYILRLLRGEFSSLEEFEEGLYRAIRRFAKRQLAWLNRWDDVVWTSGSEEDRSQFIAREFIDWSQSLVR